jgi:putative ATPase
MDLWNEQRAERRSAAAPLALRLRPRTLDEVAGQAHVIGAGRLLRRMLEADRLTSLIFWGPPGTGKTTLAEVIANLTGRHFERGNAALIGVKDVRRIMAEAQRRLEDSGRGTILFLDEIHRFSRNQQDVLLNDVEAGFITLIGATTENPYFTVNSALISRSTLFRLEPLSEEDVAALLRRAATDPRSFGGRTIDLHEEAIRHWARLSDGDARRALNALETAVLSQAAGGDEGGGDAQELGAPIEIDLATAEESIQAKALVYDGAGDEHYDVISAFIKSMRGGDPDAAVYWLALMLESGEDPRFIARRIAILASEDIGNADPSALRVAHDAWALTERIGMPECQLTLGQAAVYMALAPKSNASALAIWGAMSDVREGRTIPVPKHLRDSHYAGAKFLGHGAGYQYPHSAAGGHVRQDYLGVEKRYYEPTDRGLEADLRRRLDAMRSAGESEGSRPTDGGSDGAGRDDRG